MYLVTRCGSGGGWGWIAMLLARLLGRLLWHRPACTRCGGSPRCRGGGAALARGASAGRGLSERRAHLAEHGLARFEQEPLTHGFVLVEQPQHLVRRRDAPLVELLLGDLVEDGGDFVPSLRLALHE